MLLIEAKNQALKVYSQSLDTNEIKKAINDYASFSNETWLNEDDKADLYALVSQLQVKRELLLYFNNGFTKEDYDYASSCFDKIIKLATDKNYQKTLSIANNAKTVLQNIYSVVFDLSSYRNNMCDFDGVRKLHNIQDFLPIKEALNKKLELANGLICGAVFPNGVTFIDVKEVVVKKVQDLIDYANKSIKAIQDDINEKFLKTYAKKIDELIFKYYEIGPLFDFERSQYAKCLIVNTPFIQEMRLMALMVAKRNNLDMYEIHANSFVGFDYERLKALFAMLKEHNTHLIIEGLDKYTDSSNKRDLIRELIKYGKDGYYVLIRDSFGNNIIYNDFNESLIKDGDLTIMDFSSTYLSMPDFEDVVEFLTNLELITGEYDPLVSEIKEKLPFMGFVGLNEIKKGKLSGDKNFIKIGKRYSDANNTQSTKAYIKRLSNQSLLIDSGWGDYSSEIVIGGKTRPDFDYDNVREINVNNVRKILEGNFTLFQKCGLIVEYCLLGRDDVSFWPNLSNEEQSIRATNATRFVFQVLGIFDIVPQVEVLDELSNSHAGGLCCDGGKRIQYKKEYINNYDWFFGCILHESFHAFQAFSHSNRTPYCEWFFTELGVTRGRIEQWKLNNAKYINLETNDRNSQKFNAYKYQIMEGDANAFAQDCKQAINNGLIATIDFE